MDKTLIVVVCTEFVNQINHWVNSFLKIKRAEMQRHGAPMLNQVLTISIEQKRPIVTS